MPFPSNGLHKKTATFTIKRACLACLCPVAPCRLMCPRRPEAAAPEVAPRPEPTKCSRRRRSTGMPRSDVRPRHGICLQDRCRVRRNGVTDAGALKKPSVGG